ncbi:MAG: DUF1015 family protein [Actinomycetes bacterium]
MTERGGQTWAGTDVWGRSRDPDGLHLAPFRGIRFDESRVDDLASLTAPPYDVIGADVARALEAADPHNVVRLILPEDDPDSPQGRYDRAARTLKAWRDEKVLITDDDPALYVYEQSSATAVQRGLIGAVGLRPHEDGVILAHEDTMPGPVADRLRLMSATRANLEPIFLLYHGGGPTSDLIEKVVVTEPLASAATDDGVTHRLWRMSDPALVRTVNEDLAPKQALIADGHHRYATYLRMQAQARAAGRGAGPWDVGLALLVDVEAYPPVVSAIHRVVHGLSLPEALRRMGPSFEAEPVPDVAEGRGRLARRAGDHAFLLVSGAECVLLHTPDPGLLTRTLPTGPSDAWRSLDATVLHSTLFELWGLADDESTVTYHHAAESALRAAATGEHTAVLLNPVGVGDVLAVTAAGDRMPRKSTSFGPKPRTGFVLRHLEID